MHKREDTPMLSNKDLLQEPSARAPRFEAIWDKTKGTDFEKTLAMLEAYCEFKTWGTHSSGVGSVVKQYVGSMLSNGYCKTVKDKNVLLFKIEFLLLQLSEQIDFNKIKVEGSLAALFHVIFTHTNINAYDFAQGTKLYAAYEKKKDKTKEHAANKRGEMDIFAWFKQDVDPSITDFLIKVLLMGCDWEIRCDHGLPVIFDEKIFYRLFAHLLSKKDRIENWDNIEKVLMNQPKFSFTHLLYYVAQRQSTCEINYLLKEKKPNIRALDNISVIYKLSDYPGYRTLLQTIMVCAADRPLYSDCQSDYIRYLGDVRDYLRAMEIFIQYDPGCVCVEDGAGRNTLYYWNRVISTINSLPHMRDMKQLEYQVQAMKEREYQKLYGDVFSMICNISSMIDNNFHYPKRAFTFFQGKSDNGEENNIKMLPNDVLGLICAHTMHLEISLRK
jgi:hypothetical protein